ncbi:5757_t:CDS:1, partial [Dentiscutata heterogama]
TRKSCKNLEKSKESNKTFKRIQNILEVTKISSDKQEPENNEESFDEIKIIHKKKNISLKKISPKKILPKKIRNN